MVLLKYLINLVNRFYSFPGSARVSNGADFAPRASLLSSTISAHDNQHIKTQNTFVKNVHSGWIGVQQAVYKRISSLFPAFNRRVYRVVHAPLVSHLFLLFLFRGFKCPERNHIYAFLEWGTGKTNPRRGAASAVPEFSSFWGCY
jgi:hypothetical protein